MAEAKTYEGSCHCGAVAYEVSLALGTVVSCNCSRCSRLGWLLTFATPDKFKLKSGEDALSEYRFNTHAIAHLFCKSCGIESFARGKTPEGTEMVAINVRCLDGVDPAHLAVTPFDGRNLR